MMGYGPPPHAGTIHKHSAFVHTSFSSFIGEFERCDLVGELENCKLAGKLKFNHMSNLFKDVPTAYVEHHVSFSCP